MNIKTDLIIFNTSCTQTLNNQPRPSRLGWKLGVPHTGLRAMPARAGLASGAMGNAHCCDYDKHRRKTHTAYYIRDMQF